VARVYTIATVALALDVERKWLDNVFTHYRVPGAPQHKQGIARRLTGEAVLILQLALHLTDELGIPISRGIGLATTLVETRGDYSSPGKISISFDFPTLEEMVQTRLAAAVEIAPVPRRGRPTQNKTGRLD
jgi:hypothetical protein